jgi:hypothetical protein
MQRPPGPQGHRRGTVSGKRTVMTPVGRREATPEGGKGPSTPDAASLDFVGGGESPI